MLFPFVAAPRSPPIMVTADDNAQHHIFAGADSVSTAGGGGNGGMAVVPLYTEMEALHLSRQDNPFVQKLSSQDNLDEIGLDRRSLARCNSQSVVSTAGGISLMSPEPPYSPTKSLDPLVLSEVHDHMVRF